MADSRALKSARIAGGFPLKCAESEVRPHVWVWLRLANLRRHFGHVQSEGRWGIDASYRDPDVVAKLRPRISCRPGGGWSTLNLRRQVVSP